MLNANTLAILALDSFLYSAMPASNSNATNSNATNSHKGENMETATNATNATNSNSKSRNNSKSRKASAPKAHNSNATLPEVMPEVCNAGITAKETVQDAQTAAIFRHHIRCALAAYGGTATICQVYNFLRGDSPLRLEKDGAPKVDGLPRWRGLGNSKLFRNYTEGTLLTYTHKVCSNGRVRSVAVAGPMLQEK